MVIYDEFRQDVNALSPAKNVLNFAARKSAAAFFWFFDEDTPQMQGFFPYFHLPAPECYNTVKSHHVLAQSAQTFDAKLHQTPDNYTEHLVIFASPHPYRLATSQQRRYHSITDKRHRQGRFM
ncbi:hypothetical protein [Thalassospira australica]|uniref:hypothetical protein n=1 Tax=Thalassospira australica TaxID=1528106 RepID=UPI00051A1053|nr:hypothetical protein [Thalassospira australica]